MHIPDLSRKTYNKHDDGFQYFSVGWLGADVPRKGGTSELVLESLKEHKERCQLLDQYRGRHACEICGSHHEKGEFYVQSGAVRFVLPNMVIHYIEEHGYKLPDEVEFVILSKIKLMEATVEIRRICEKWEAQKEEA
jgi:hypothetical protein